MKEKIEKIMDKIFFKVAYVGLAFMIIMFVVVLVLFFTDSFTY